MKTKSNEIQRKTKDRNEVEEVEAKKLDVEGGNDEVEVRV